MSVRVSSGWGSWVLEALAWPVVRPRCCCCCCCCCCYFDVSSCFRSARPAAVAAALPRCFVNSLTESPSVEVSAGVHDVPDGTQRLPAPTLRRCVGAVRSLVFVIGVQVPLRPLSVRFRFGFGLSAEVRSSGWIRACSTLASHPASLPRGCLRAWGRLRAL